MTAARGRLRRALAAGTVCLAALLFPSAAGAFAGPESRPSAYDDLLPPEMGDVPARAANHARLCADLLLAAEGNLPAVQERLLELQRAVLEPLLAHVEDGDLEVRLRVGETLEQMVVEARVVRMMAHLPVGQRLSLRRFRAARPALFEGILSPVQGRRVAALRKLTRQSDPDRLAEPIVILCLRNPYEAIVAEAAAAAERCGYRSDAVVDALSQVLIRYREGLAYSDEWRSGQFVSPSAAALGALGNIGGPKAAAAVVESLRNPSLAHQGLAAHAVEALAAADEKRAIPALMRRIDANDRSYSSGWASDSGSGTSRPGDYALWAVLRLTGQAPEAYGLVLVDWSSFGGPSYAGFLKEKDRQQAYAKVHAWWAVNKDRPPYKDLAPLEAPADTVPASQGALTSPARRGDRTASVPASLPSDEITPQVRRLTARLAEAFRSPSYSARDACRRQLLDLYLAALGPLAERVEDPLSPAARPILDALDNSVVEAGLHSFACQLPRDLRAMLWDFHRSRPDLARAALSLNTAIRLDAAREIAKLDANAGAEPLVLLYLKDPAPEVARAGVRMAAGGAYRGDAVVDALTDLLTDASEQEWSMAMYASGGEDNAVLGAVKALGRIRSPRAAPVLAALALRRSAGGQGGFPPALADALVACGEPGVIPPLLEKLGDTHVVMNTSFGGRGGTVTVARSDVPLLLLLKLTNQQPADYQMLVSPGGARGLVGFKDEKTRQAAIQKFREWWSRAKDSPPYSNLKAVPIPGLPQTSTHAPGQGPGLDED